MNRRKFLNITGGASVLALGSSFIIPELVAQPSKFRFCLNTSTVSGQKPGLRELIELTAKAGYDGIELWVRDVREYLNEGKTLKSIKKHIKDSGIVVENAIGFAEWMVEDEVKRKAGFTTMKEDMELMAELECKRIAASPAGLNPEKKLDLEKAGCYYKQLIDLGRQTGVMPQLEFWGASGTLYSLGQAMMIAAAAGDPDVHILADVYHMFRGQSSFESLKMLQGNVIEIFHMNDYVSQISRDQQTDKDRVFPGDGAAPMPQILTDLNRMGGVKVLSLELFNQTYWKQDAMHIARTGLEKMRRQVSLI